MKGACCPLFLLMLRFSFFILFLFFTLLPSYERDEILYHLAIPKFLIVNNFSTPDFSHFFYYPILPSLFNFVALYLKLPVITHVLHLLMFVATLYLVTTEIKHKNSFYITLILLTLQPVLRFSYTAYADFYMLFFVTASFILIKRWFEGGNNFNLYLSALCCGLGLNTKYNMLVMALMFYFLVLWLAYEKHRSVKKTIFFGLIYTGISVTLFIPHLLKNYLLTNNPLYPLLGNIFHSNNPFAFENVSHFVFRKYFYDENIFQILLTPLMVFFYGKENNIQYFDGVLNPFFAIFPVIAIFAIKKKEYTLYFLFGWLYNYFVLFLEPVSARFLLPSVPIFAIVTAEGLSRINLSEKKVALLVLPFLLFNFYFGGKHIVDKDKWLYLIGKMSKDEFLERKCPDYKSIKFINENTPKEAKVFYIFSGQRTYYLERDFVYDSFNDGRLFKRIFEGCKDETELYKKFREMGVTHLFLRDDLFTKFVTENLSPQEVEVVKSFFKNMGKTVFIDNFFLVFEINND